MEKVPRVHPNEESFKIPYIWIWICYGTLTHLEAFSDLQNLLAGFVKSQFFSVFDDRVLSILQKDSPSSIVLMFKNYLWYLSVLFGKWKFTERCYSEIRSRYIWPPALVPAVSREWQDHLSWNSWIVHNYVRPTYCENISQSTTLIYQPSAVIGRGLRGMAL